MGTGAVQPACAFNVTADTTDDGNSSTIGKATDVNVTGSLGNANLGSTGAFVATPSVPNDPPADGDTTTSASAHTGTGTCVRVNGGATCPPSTAVVGISVNEADGVTRTTPGTGCWLGAGSTCALQNTGVGVGRDAGSTAQVTTAPPVGTRTVDIPGGGVCIQLGATC